MRFAKLTVLFVLLLVCSTVWAAVPKLINFQGILKDGSGNPVTDGSYSVGFKIFDAASGGNVLWAETLSVTTTGGLFTVLLGSSNPVPDTAFDDTTRWLGITVASDPEMSPRQQLVTVPYAFRSTAGGGFPQGMEEFTSPGSHQFVVPAGVTAIFVEIWGAGGGGGGGGTTGCSGGGGGGGAGGYSRTILSVLAGETYNVNIGAGGTAGSLTSLGGDGDSSSFKTGTGTTLLSSEGGKGGQPGVSASPGAGGGGGVGGIGDPGAAIRRTGNGGGSGGTGGCGFVNTPGIGGVGGFIVVGTIEPLGVKGGTGGRGFNNSGVFAGGNGYVIIQW